MTMAYSLVKSEPSVWSWDQQVAKGAKGEAWTGVRNFTFGINLGKGDSAKDIHGKTGLAEGAFTAPVLLEMARRRDVDMPISAAVAAVLTGQMSVDQAIESLLARPIRAEH